MTFVVILHVLVCVFLVAIILIQPGKSDGGIGFGSSSQSIFGSRGAGNFLTKLTSFAAVFYLVSSFFLTRDRIKQYSQTVIQAEPAAAPAAKELEKSPTPPPPATPESKK